MSALFDTNVLFAASLNDHKDQLVALAVLNRADAPAVALHSLSELYNTLTKPKPYARSPEMAAQAVSSFSQSLAVVALSADDHLHALTEFAALGGIGARLYDYLIGAAARSAGIPTLISLNSRDFIPLFPNLTVLTPAQYLETL